MDDIDRSRVELCPQSEKIFNKTSPNPCIEWLFNKSTMNALFLRFISWWTLIAATIRMHNNIPLTEYAAVVIVVLATFEITEGLYSKTTVHYASLHDQGEVPVRARLLWFVLTEFEFVLDTTVKHCYPTRHAMTRGRCLQQRCLMLLWLLIWRHLKSRKNITLKQRHNVIRGRCLQQRYFESDS